MRSLRNEHPARMPPRSERDVSAAHAETPRTGLTDVADVMEVIAEYACSTVADACALRWSCKGYRRAVDTTVRRLVCATQPQLRGAAAAPLLLQRDTDSLDVMRIAHSSDTFARIARLVIVAFALDGPKDEAREGGLCGPRSFVCSDGNEYGTPFPKGSCWWPSDTVSTGPRQCWRHALMHNVTDVVMPACNVSDAMCDLIVGPLRLWRNVSRLALTGFGSEGPTARLLRALAPQLTQLSFTVRLRAVEDALAMCTSLCLFPKLQCVAVGFVQNSDHVAHAALSAAIADAIIDGGAPVTHLFAWDMLEVDALRLIEQVPTIVHVSVNELRHYWGRLPPAVARRMIQFSEMSGDAEFPNMAVHRLVNLTFPPDMQCRGAQEVSIRELTDPDLTTDIRLLPLPSSLVRINVTFPKHDTRDSTTRFVHRLGLTQPHLPFLAELILPPVADIAPLARFSSTLTTLSFTVQDSETSAYFPFVNAVADDAELLKFEAVVRNLCHLRSFDAPFLPTGRCFLEGRHTELRELHVKHIDAPEAGVSLEALCRACPRLIRVLGQPWGWPYPAEWQQESASLVRKSFRGAPFAFKVEQFPPDRSKLPRRT